MQQQRRVERGRRAAGFLDCPRLLPDKLVPRFVRGHVPGPALGRYQLRVRQLARQFNKTLAARVSERLRIARELHDTLLQSFQGLLLRFQSAAKLLPERPDEARQRLDNAIQQAAEAITEGRDAVQDLRSSAFETNDLANGLKAIGEELITSASGPDFPAIDVEVEGSPRNLSPLVRDEAYRIASEALRNAFRHAQARRITVEIGYERRQFRLRVRDDGKGIDGDTIRGQVPGHFGLHGMRERAEIVGGRLEVWSKLDSGTEIDLIVPSAVGLWHISSSRRGCQEYFPRRAEIVRAKTMSDAKPIQILTVDDHPVLRQGIAALIADELDMTVVGEATNGREAIQQFRAHHPDVTLMDLQMPEMNGLDAMIAIRAEFPEARIIVLTTYTGDVQARRAIQAGARAYLLKNSLHKELLDTIRAVHAGRKNLSPEVSFELAEHAAEDTLSPLEVRVLRLIADGNSNKEIAALLSVTEDSVKGHVRNILSKLGANDRAHAAIIGVKRGIIEL